MVIFMVYFDNLTEEEIEQYKPLLDRSTDEVKIELRTLVKDYYNSVINNDIKLYNSSVSKINKYIELDIIDINEYLNYCFVVESNNIIKQLFDTDSVSTYNPKKVDLEFRTKYVRQNEQYIKREGLSDSELKLITQYIKEKHDIHCLSLLLDDCLITELKPKTVLPNELHSIIINTNYMRGETIKKSGELYFALDNRFGNMS